MEKKDVRTRTDSILVFPAFGFFKLENIVDKGNKDISDSHSLWANVPHNRSGFLSVSFE